MSKKKKKISIPFYPKSMGLPEILRKINAYDVDGVFAVGVIEGKALSGSGKLVVMLCGDDGKYWEIASYDSTWLDRIIDALQKIRKEI